MACGVYELSFGNGHRYIGSSCDVERRLQDHRRLMRRGQHENPAVQNVFDQHGDPASRLLLVCERKDLVMYEQLCLDGLKPDLNCSTIAGRIEFTQEVRDKMRAAALKPERRAASSARMKQTLAGMSPEERRRAAQNRTGTVSSPETRARQSEAMKAYCARVGPDEMSRRALLQKKSISKRRPACSI